MLTTWNENNTARQLRGRTAILDTQFSLVFFFSYFHGVVDPQLKILSPVPHVEWTSETITSGRNCHEHLEKGLARTLKRAWSLLQGQSWEELHVTLAGLDAKWCLQFVAWLQIDWLRVERVTSAFIGPLQIATSTSFAYHITNIPVGLFNTDTILY